MSTPFPLLLAAALLVLGHAVPSWPGVRPRLLARLGRAGFATLHSLLSLATLALFILAYRHAAFGDFVFVPADGAAALAVALMPLAFLLVLARLTTRAGDPQAPDAPCGIHRITRHPGSTGILLWALLHLQATGDLRRFILFTAMGAIALFSIAKNEWLLRRAGTPAAEAWRAATGILPFTAILAGRQRLVWREIGWWRVAAALALAAAVLHAHPLVFGVDPLYWL